MSHVDSANHVYCADLQLGKGLIPVYWLFEGGLKHDRTRRPVTKHDLLIGGGFGEHPALHIKNADLLPLWAFLRMRWRDDRHRDLEDWFAGILQLRCAWDKSVTEYPFEFANFMDIADWPLSSLSKIQDTHNSKIIKGEGCAETEFIISVALFVKRCMPREFYEDYIFKQMSKIPSDSDIFDHPSLMKFLPPTQGTALGKVIKDGKAVWGYTLNDYLKDKGN